MIEDVRAYNRAAWDGLVRTGNRWTVPVTSEVVARATLEDQLGGQLAADFVLADLYEDSWAGATEPVHRFMKCYLGTRAIKPASAAALTR